MKRSGELNVFILLLIVNLVIAILYLLVSFLRKKELRRDCLIRFVIMILCPAIAEGFFFFSWVFFRTVFHRQVDLTDVIFSKERGKTYRKADEQAESNLVPLEEALAVTDRTSTRVLMMDVIRRDISDTLRTISLALDSDDSEVAHYGASILQSAIGDFRKQAQDLSDEIKKAESEIKDDAALEKDTEKSLLQNERELIQDLNLVLRQHVLSPQEETEYVQMMDETTELLRKHASPSADELAQLCSRFLEIGNTDRCRYWADLSEELYPEELSTYTNYLKLFYETKDTDAFFERLEKLKASDIVIDHQTLEVIRLFQSPEKA